MIAEAKVILNNMASCITKDVSTLKNLINEMEDLWETAKDMPSAIKDVAARCSAEQGKDDSLHASGRGGQT